MYADTLVYKITMGDKRQFDDHFRIRIPLDGEMVENGPIRLAYWDEDFLEWTPLPTEVDEEEGFVYGYTDHLTMVRIMSLITMGYKHIGGDHFIVIYDPNDTFDIEDHRITSIVSMAMHTGDLLDQIYNRYKGALGDDYSPDYFYGERSWWDRTTGIKTDKRPIVWLLSRNNEAGAYYNSMTRETSLPTSYAGYEELATTIGHELFHAFQHDGRYRSKRLTSAEMAGGRRWLMEATAEYAAHYLATDPPVGMSVLPVQKDRGSLPGLPLNHFSNKENGHEYGMATFIHFLVKEKGANFPDMWRYIIDNRLGGVLNAFDRYVLSTTGSQPRFHYLDFWRHVLTNSEMPRASHLSQIASLSFFDDMEQMSRIARDMRISQPYNMAVTRFAPRVFDGNGKAVIIVELESPIPEGAHVDVFKVSGHRQQVQDGGTRIELYDRVSGGKEPEGHLPSADYVWVEMDEANSELLLITAEGWHEGVKDFNIRIKQLDFELEPTELKNVNREETYEFKATIENLPKAMKNIAFRWKLASGETIVEEVYENDGGKISDTLKFSFSRTMGPVELQNIEMEVINLETGEVIKKGSVTVDEEDAEVRILGDRNNEIVLRGPADGYYEYEHSFEAVVRPAAEAVYQFNWDFGDGHTYSETGKTSSYTHTYKDLKEGDVFNPSVSINLPGEREVISEDSIRISFEREVIGEQKYEVVVYPAFTAERGEYPLRRFEFVLVDETKVLEAATARKGSALTGSEKDEVLNAAFGASLGVVANREAIEAMLPADVFAKLRSRELYVLFHGTYTQYWSVGPTHPFYGDIEYQGEYDMGYLVRVLIEDDRPLPGQNPVGGWAPPGSVQ